MRGSPSVDVIRPKPEAPTEEVLASEAAKGYDLLVIGLERVVAKGTFDTSVNRIAAQFEGPLALAVARGVHLERDTGVAIGVEQLEGPAVETEQRADAHVEGRAAAVAPKAPEPADEPVD